MQEICEIPKPSRKQVPGGNQLRSTYFFHFVTVYTKPIYGLKTSHSISSFFFFTLAKSIKMKGFLYFSLESGILPINQKSFL